MARIYPILEAWRECPRADECFCNYCPLTLRRYQSDPSDPQPKCSVAKSVRKRIGEKWHLKNLGLKPRELSAYKSWHSQPEEIKQLKLQQLQQNSPIVRLSAKGYQICPKKQNSSQLHGQTPQTTPENAVERGVGQ